MAAISPGVSSAKHHFNWVDSNSSPDDDDDNVHGSKRGRYRFGRKVTLSNIGVPEHKIVSILEDNTQMKMEILLKKVFIKKGSWMLVHNLYDVRNLQVVRF
ncbi:hypothetical protein RR48_06939 [Papilio machaon]|uniref:Uncharacterized protein n=1 Tax=Papilio machaon TaxID=76193 RepID=A0A194R9K7_PAPMA|nr:hypothetical protein RR48_06939 [Papilio machaon]